MIMLCFSFWWSEGINSSFKPHKWGRCAINRWN